MTYHDAARPRDIHVIHQYEFTNEANRLAGIDLNLGSLTLVANDIGKVGRQLDTGEFYLLVDVAPITWQEWGVADALHTVKDKNLVANNTVSDGALATASAITTKPANAGYVQVFVNGNKVELADGGVTPGSCYFSNDGGATRRLIANIENGDTLHWVGSFASYQLETSDRIDFDYEEQEP